MLEIRSAGAKGFGVFATQPIARGTRIFAERPLLSVRRERDIYAAARQLTPAQHAALHQLSINPVRQSDALGWTHALWHALRHHLRRPDPASSLPSSLPSSASPSLLPRSPPSSLATFLRSWPSALAAHTSLRHIFRNNNFDLGDGTQAVFARISRLNHACVPSAQGNFHARLGVFAVHAVRDLACGEEVTVSYLVEHAAGREARQRRLREGYGFLCGCDVCDATSAKGRASEERRTRMRARLTGFCAEGGERDSVAEVEVTEALIGLFEEEGIRGRELATMYISAAEMRAKLGERGKARELAEEGLRVERECVGTDSPFYKESLERVRSGVELLA